VLIETRNTEDGEGMLGSVKCLWMSVRAFTKAELESFELGSSKWEPEGERTSCPKISFGVKMKVVHRPAFSLISTLLDCKQEDTHLRWWRPSQPGYYLPVSRAHWSVPGSSLRRRMSHFLRRWFRCCRSCFGWHICNPRPLSRRPQR